MSVDPQKSHLLATINQFALDIMQIDSQKALLWHVTTEVVRNMGFTDCVVYEVDYSARQLKQVAAYGEKAPDRITITNPLKIPLGKGITGSVAISGKGENILDVSKDNRYILDIKPALSEICVPIIVKGKVFGVIDCESEQKAKFTSEHMATLTTVAGMTAARIELLRESDRALQMLEELRQSNEKLEQEKHQRLQAEKKLHKAQTMEVIGQMTGGVAHDFNNYLAVILGNMELLALTFPATEQFTEPVFRSLERANELTMRLLAFARKHPLHPQSINLPELLNSFSELMSLSSGEHYRITIKHYQDLWHALADPGQLENAIMNLAFNARDSMPEGGEISIECSNFRVEDQFAEEKFELSAGDYVCISVNDSGHGMAADIKDRAIEPFFTTKEVGAGSGLGLSMVYGFAQQSGGQVNIYSKPNIGTTVKLYLPRSSLNPDKQSLPQYSALPQGKNETVLVVEDDPDVRSLASIMLRSLNYKVITATDGIDAREVFKNERHVDIMLSDIVLPRGLSGPEFAKEATRLDPKLCVVFMSGYSTEAAHGKKFLDGDNVLLNKPFHLAQLAVALRTELDKRK